MTEWYLKGAVYGLKQAQKCMGKRKKIILFSTIPDPYDENQRFSAEILYANL
jgi:hypothetical protein